MGALARATAATPQPPASHSCTNPPSTYVTPLCVQKKNSTINPIKYHSYRKNILLESKPVKFEKA